MKINKLRFLPQYFVIVFIFNLFTSQLSGNETDTTRQIIVYQFDIK